jgi:hypothetical protein
MSLVRFFPRYNPHIANPLIISALLTLFLFYIDEGYYSFRWMLEPGAWIVFGIYTLLFFTCQALLIYFFRRWPGRLASIAKYTLGAVLGFAVAYVIFKG